MEKGNIISARKVKIDKAQSTTLAVIGAAAFVIVFSLFASKALLSKMSFQNRVISAQQASLKQIASDSQSSKSLVSSYRKFVSGSTNVLGGTVTGTASNDGTNAKIILDALPDTYDFPALATSIENLIGQPGVSITSIAGTDTGSGSTAVASTSGSATTTAAPGVATPMPFQFSVTSPYLTDISDSQSVLNQLLASIRPIDIQSIELSGTDAALVMAVSAQTYYQPSTGLTITTETVK